MIIWDENAFQSGDFSDIDRFVYISGTIPSILFYVPQSVELLGLTTVQFLNQDPRPPFFKEILTPLSEPSNKLTKTSSCYLFTGISFKTEKTAL